MSWGSGRSKNAFGIHGELKELPWGSKSQSCRRRGHETHSFRLKNREKPESPHVVSYFLNGLSAIFPTIHAAIQPNANVAARIPKAAQPL